MLQAHRPGKESPHSLLELKGLEGVELQHGVPWRIGDIDVENSLAHVFMGGMGLSNIGSILLPKTGRQWS